MSVFGDLKSPSAVEKAVEKSLRRWLPTYVKEAGRQAGLKLTPVRSYSIVSEYGKFPEKGQPAVVIESAGLADEPEEDEAANLTGTFSVQVTVVAHGPDADLAREFTLAYSTAIVAALMQHRILAEDITVKRFVDSAFAGANIEKRRTEVAVGNAFLIEHENFLNIGEGPLEPDLVPGDWPTVKTVEIEVEKEN